MQVCDCVSIVSLFQMVSLVFYRRKFPKAKLKHIINMLLNVPGFTTNVSDKSQVGEFIGLLLILGFTKAFYFKFSNSGY